jgi:protein involved in polysaccharide export with SLBB domain
MRIIRILVIWGMCATCVLASFGQGALSSADLRNVDIDRLSDSDIRAYYSKAAESGLSEDQLFDLARARGLSDLQVTKLKDRVVGLGLAGAMGSKKATGESMLSGENPTINTEDAIRRFDEKLGQVPMVSQSFNRRIFGSELFSETSTTFEPNLRIATPSNYILGPDDELIINVYGYSEKTYRQQVNAEGNIYIENVGPILVSGMTIEEAESKIKGRLGATIYKAMKSGTTKMQLRLGNIRSMRITIIGEAKKPGTYTVSSLTTLFNALYLCGGPTDNGSYRNIEVVRGNKSNPVGGLIPIFDPRGQVR